MAPETPPSERELEAEEHFAQPGCTGRGTLLVPGLPQFCRGDRATGTALLSLGTLELGTAVGAGMKNGFGSSSAGRPLLAFGDLVTLSAMDAALESQRARRLLYVPQESLAEMALAPFSTEVLARPEVWAGVVGTVALGLAFSELVEGGLSTSGFGKRPVLFGREMNSAVGYPLAGAIGVGLFEHVAIAEESVFRGLLQSGLSRRYGETRGLVYGSLAFGLVHASNVAFLAPEDRLRYLAFGVPFITLLGGYLGFIYQRDGYTLGPGIAVHFWYDLLIEATSFVLDPKNSPLALRAAVPF